MWIYKQGQIALKTKRPLRALRLAGWIWPFLFSALTLVLTEWIHRGSLEGFWQEYFLPHKNAYYLSFLLLLACYLILLVLTRRHWPATLGVGVLGCLPATVCFFELQLRGEPFLPWDFSQFGEATQVVGQAGLKWETSMKVSLVVILAATVLAAFLPKTLPGWKKRLVEAALSVSLLLGLVYGVYLQPQVTLDLGIVPDEWMQDRYYRYYGVITGFMTNLQNLDIDEPEDYSEEAMKALKEEILSQPQPDPLFAGSYAEQGQGNVTQPTIIYVMDESFWDVSRLEEYGVTFDREICPNLHQLQESSAWGRVYSPSFGGGTCDVEFEALTGHSCTYLPTGCKPYQQHVTGPTFALPAYLKEEFGYETIAIHGYYKKFWNRIRAYPNLGIDTFIGLEDMDDPEKKRPADWQGGLVTDAEMARQIISAYEEREGDEPLFLHAVTMQNHTSYTAKNYPDEERVRVLEAPEGLDEETVGALEDFATGCREADAMLGQLTEYFSQVEEPVILVFWGDHYNPVGSGYQVYTATGYASGDSNDPQLHQTDLLIWSNYWQEPVELGTIAAYEVSPVMMDLYGLEKPLYFEYMTRQLSQGYRSCTLGTTVNPDGSFSNELTQEQRVWYQNHWLLEYDLLFGQEYFLDEES